MNPPTDYGLWIFITVLVAAVITAGAIMFLARKHSARLEAERADIAAQTAAAHADRTEAAQVLAQARQELARIAALDEKQARAEMEADLIDQAKRAAAAYIHRVEADAKATAEQRALRVVAGAVQRVAGPTSAQLIVDRIQLPNEEMKGRIIGKEGRNIRSFEAITGVNLIIDDSPSSVMLSSFDAERREVAALTLEELIADGRIHPGRIEQVHREVEAGATARHDAAGHAAARRAGVDGLHPDLITTLGQLRLRTSYGQNVLEHLVESAHIAEVMAAEIGADVALARRAAFLHDLGKASPPGSGPHAEIGAALARRCGESEAVVNAIAAHHNEVEPNTVEAVLVQAADACSASRPGARREELDQFIERLERLEEVVGTHVGVKAVAALSAGREVRVIVEPDSVSDADLPGLVQTITDHIQRELTYPGEITVTAIRETRASASTG